MQLQRIPKKKLSSLSQQERKPHTTTKKEAPATTPEQATAHRIQKNHPFSSQKERSHPHHNLRSSCYHNQIGSQLPQLKRSPSVTAKESENDSQRGAKPPQVKSGPSLKLDWSLMLQLERRLPHIKIDRVQGEESRWRRNRTGRSLSLLQIH